MTDVVLSLVDSDGCPTGPVSTLSTHDTYEEALAELRRRYAQFPDLNFDMIDSASGRWVSWAL